MLSSLLRSLLGRRPSKHPVAEAAAASDAPDSERLLEAASAALVAQRYSDALRDAEGAFALSPGLPDALLVRGCALAGLGRAEEAQAALAKALAQRPDHAQTRLQLGIVLHRLGEYAEAFDVLAPACEVPETALRAHIWSGDAAARLGRYPQAAQALERALALDPDQADVRASLALILLRHLERPEEALQHSGAAYALDPSLPVVRLNHALALQGTGQYEAALRIYETPFEDERYRAMARMNVALIRLGRGEFDSAWDDYEARRDLDEFEYSPPGIPDWQGESLASKRVLAYWEQGLGDEIMFASCLPDLIRSSSQCIVQCSPRLEALFRRSFPSAVVRGVAARWFDAEDRVDVRVAFGSLPRVFRRSREAFPRHAGYLRADSQRVAHWSRVLGERFGPGLKVGLSWRGGLAHTRRSLRSLPLEQMLVLMKARADSGFASLQYGDCEEEIDRVTATDGVRLAHWQDAIDDYDETAALVCALDVVITVCTAVAHLAGALGKPVWVLVPSVPEWRYMHRGEQMPWYPSMRLFRARQPGEWGGVLAQIVDRLARAGSNPQALVS